MSIGSSSVQGVLMAATFTAAFSLGVVHLTHDSGAARPTVPDTFVTWQRPPVLVVVSADSRSDVAVGLPAAEAQGGALLAVTAAGLTEAMTAGLSRSRPGQVLILGGPDAVTEATASALRQYTSGPVNRLSGSDRFMTAAMVARSQFSSPVRRVRILSGDAEGVSQPADEPEAGATPVLLVEGTRIPPSAAAALRHLYPQSIEVVGGPRAVSDGVLRQLQAFTPGRVVRVP